ncbi:MAG: OmpH family outer membrane protein [Desulfobacteraceae bacterium]|nr:OmpH family outer membrane protein [Desulfobacteraceae bacterium]MCF8095073.1 OmpH family outer membrane protein [Desulfobacteraceae bacterium]
MKAMKVFGAILACTMFFAVSAYAADVARIGIIDFQKVLEESEAGKKVQQNLQEQGKEMEADLQALAKEIEELNKQLSGGAMVMSEEKRQEKQRELEIKKYDFQSKRKKYQSEFRETESELVGKLRDEIFSIAEEIGKKKGYLLIIEKSAAVYYPDSIDITSEVIRQYNDRFGSSLPPDQE